MGVWVAPGFSDERTEKKVDRRVWYEKKEKQILVMMGKFVC